MDPSEFDKAIQGKLQSETAMYRQERDQVKLAVWSQVNENLDTNRQVAWYWLVAAAVLLLITFYSVIFTMNQNHKREMSRLSSELTEAKNLYTQQSAFLEDNQEQLTILTSQLEMAKKESTVQLVSQAPIIKERVIHHVDTVFITEVKYIAQSKSDDESEVVNQVTTIEDSNDTIEQAESLSTAPAFIAVASNTTTFNNNESLKVKFGSFTKKLRNQ